MHTPEQSSGHAWMLSRRTLLGSAAAAALSAVAGITIHEANEPPNEWDLVKEKTKATVEKKRENVRYLVYQSINQYEEGIEYMDALVEDDEGFVFETSRTGAKRSFRLQKAECLPKENKKDGKKEKSTFVDLDALKGKVIDTKDEGEKVKLLGTYGMITMQRMEVDRIFHDLSTSKKNADPLIIGSIACLVEGEYLFISYKDDHLGHLHFKETEPDSSKESFAMR